MPKLFFTLTLFAYGLSFVSYLRFLSTGKELAGRIGTAMLSIGLVTHYFALLERSRGLHTVPYHDLYGSMSLFGWLLALTYLGLELYHRQRSVGAFVLPFIIIFLVAAQIVPADRLAPTPVRGPVFALHVSLSILAYAAFGLSCVLSVMFLLEDRLLRHRKLGEVVWRLPPLELLERMSQSSVLVGLLAIAAGTILGFVWVDRLTGPMWDPKYLFTLIVLVLYAVYFGLSRTTRWRGARASRLCVFNFFLVVFSFTVVNLYLSHSHRYF
jgi:HemX protein